MTARLPDHLDLIASAPEGIKKLRGLILEMAVRGKLVPQDPNDEPASELLKRITKERARLEAEGVCRKSKPLPPVSEDEQPFDLPKGWEWIRLGQIGDWGAGATPLRSNPRYYGGSIPWFKSGELTADFISDAEEQVTELALKECSLRQNRTGDVLIAMYGATIGKTAILAKPATTNQAVCACTPSTGVFNRYLLTLLKALKRNFIGQGAGGAQPNISREKIVATVTALPPEAEQHRIVAKVDELMALCDQLEAEVGAGGTAHAKLVETLLGTLTQSADAADLAANWQRLTEHFDTLFTTEASIDALKQAILQLAVMGKLVPQDPTDEPASELLKRIAKARAQLEAEGKIKKSNATPVGDDGQPFDAPGNWQWQRLDELLAITGGITLGRKLSGRELISRPYLRVANVQRGHLLLDHIKSIEIPADELGKYRLQSDDLLITEGGDWDKVGRTAIWRNEIDECLHQNHVFRARPLSDEWSCRWTEMYLNAKPARDYFATSSKQTTNLASINMTQLKTCPFPVPPLAEQHRIVAKVDELMVLSNELKAKVGAGRTAQARLASTLIETALEAA